jgi:hypothetical protein
MHNQTGYNARQLSLRRSPTSNLLGSSRIHPSLHAHRPPSTQRHHRPISPPRNGLPVPPHRIPTTSHVLSHLRHPIPSTRLLDHEHVHYLSSLDGTTISTSIELPLQRKHDTSIINQASKCYKGISLKRINAVQLFLQVFSLFDITTSEGKQISTQYRHSNKLRRRTSILNWPNQAEPGALAWTGWQAMLKTCHTHRNFTLRTPLGCWLDTTPTQNWHTLVCSRPVSQ